MQITTFNIRTPVDKPPYDWASRLPRVQKLIANHGLSLIGLQEARVEQLTDLCADGTFAFIGSGRKDPVERGDGEYSAIIYKKSEFAVVDSGTFWLSETPEVTGSKSWDTAYARICTWGLFEEMATKKRFYYFNTHLDHCSKAAQKNGTLLILRRMQAAMASGMSCFLTGDFNIYPTREEVAIAKLYLKYANEASETPVTGPYPTYHGYNPNAPAHTAPIDYIFVSPDVKVKSVQTIADVFDGYAPSDHFPVTAEVEF